MMHMLAPPQFARLSHTQNCHGKFRNLDSLIATLDARRLEKVEEVLAII